MKTYIQSLTWLLIISWIGRGLYGDEVMVSSKSAPVQIRNTTIAEVQQGDRFQVLERLGAWVAVEVSTETGKQRGWVHSNHLQTSVDANASAPGEPTAVAPGIAVEIDSIQVVLQGNRSHLTLQTTLKNLSDSSLTFDSSEFRLVIDSVEIEPQTHQAGGPRYSDEQIVVGFDSSARLQTRWGQPPDFLSKGELLPNDNIQKWLRFQLPSMPRDSDFSELAVVLRGKIGTSTFETDLNRNATESLKMHVRQAELNSSVQVIEIRDGLNALNFADLFGMADTQSKFGHQIVVVAKGPRFYLDRYVLNRLGADYYSASQQSNPFVFVVSANSASQTNASGTSLQMTRNLAIASSEMEATLRILGERPDTSETLISHLSDTDPKIRATVAAALAKHSGDAKVMEALITAASDSVPNVRSAAINALAGVTSQFNRGMPVQDNPISSKTFALEAVAAIVKAIEDPEYAVRMSAINSAARVNHPRIVRALVDRLRDSNDQVIIRACASLGTLKAEGAVDALEALRRSEKRAWSAAAIRALHAIGRFSPIESAYAQLKQGEPDYNDFRVLKTEADSAAVELLISYLRDPGDNQQYIDEAAELLGELKDKRATQVLLEHLQYGNRYSDKIPRALGKLGDASAIEPLWMASRNSNSNPNRQAAIYEALLRLDDPQVFKHLVNLLSNPDPQLPVSLILPVFGQAKNPLASRLVARHLDDATNQRYAAMALLEQGTPAALKLLERKLLAEDYAHGSRLLSSIYSSPSPFKMEMVYVASQSKNGETRTAALNYRRQFESAFRRREHEALVGKPFIPFEAENWGNGSAVTAEDLKGKVVLLDFWSVWCDPCISNFANLRKWQELYGRDGLVVIGLTQYYGYGWDEEAKRPFRMSNRSARDEADALENFARHHRVGHHLAFLSPDSDVSSQYFVSAMPQTVLIDRTGVIRMIRAGNSDNFVKEIEDQIARSLYEFNFDTNNDLSELRRAKGIRRINLQSSEISDESLSNIQASDSLQSLRLDDSSVSDQGLKALARKDALPRLEELGLSKTLITDQGLQQLSAFPALEILHIAASGVSDEGLKTVAQFSGIRHLSLGDGWSRASVSVKGLEHLTSMPNLERLELNGIPLTDEAINTIQELPALESIGLIGAQVSSTGLHQLLNARPELSVRIDEWSDWLHSDAYQEHFNRMTRRDYFPLEVEGKNTEQGPQYRARYVPKPSDREFTTVSIHGNSPEQFVAMEASARARNLTIVCLTEFESSDGEMKYSGTWIQGRPEAYWVTPHLEAARAFERARELYRGNDRSGALELLKVVIEKQPDHVQALNLLGIIHRGLEHEQQAAGAYTRLVDVIQEIPEQRRRAADWGFLGQAFYRLDRFEEAREALQRAINLRRETSPTAELGPRWWYFIMSLHKTNEQPQALEYFRTLAPQVDDSSANSQRDLKSETAKLLGVE